MNGGGVIKYLENGSQMPSPEETLHQSYFVDRSVGELPASNMPPLSGPGDQVIGGTSVPEALYLDLFKSSFRLGFGTETILVTLIDYICCSSQWLSTPWAIVPF